MLWRFPEVKTFVELMERVLLIQRPPQYKILVPGGELFRRVLCRSLYHPAAFHTFGSGKLVLLTLHFLLQFILILNMWWHYVFAVLVPIMFYKCMCGGLNSLLITSLGLITNFHGKYISYVHILCDSYTSFVFTLSAPYFNSCFCCIHTNLLHAYFVLLFLSLPVPPKNLVPVSRLSWTEHLPQSSFAFCYLWKSYRVLWPRWIWPRQSLSLANYDFHWRKRIRSSSSRNHPPFGGRKAS